MKKLFALLAIAGMFSLGYQAQAQTDDTDTTTVEEAADSTAAVVEEVTTEPEAPATFDDV